MLQINTIQFFHADFTLGDPYFYTECGLDNVVLLSGYEHKTIDGEMFTSIHDVDDLHKRILESLALKKELLSSKEIRFIRREMNFTQASLANLIGSSGQAVGRWEKLLGNPTPIPAANDLLLKVIVQDHIEGIAPFELLKGLSEIELGGMLSFHSNCCEEQWNIEHRLAA